MCVGLNAVRELCSRQPMAIDTTLLQDLAQYKSHRDKGVVMAARSLIALFRDRAPEMLHRRDRGKFAVMHMSGVVAADGSSRAGHVFGAQSISTDVAGAQYLRAVRIRDVLLAVLIMVVVFVGLFVSDCVRCALVERL